MNKQELKAGMLIESEIRKDFDWAWRWGDEILRLARLQSSYPCNSSLFDDLFPKWLVDGVSILFDRAIREQRRSQMIPKFRAWEIHGKKMMNKLLMISFVRKEVIGKYEAGNNSYPLKIGEEAILMQSTGLFDKNGKEIFDGDVVRVSYTDDDFTWTDKVDWDSKYLGWRISENGDLLGYLLETDDTLIEVIGSIYENPELVEGGVIGGMA